MEDEFFLLVGFWKMSFGRWKMGFGRWKMIFGRWNVEDDQMKYDFVLDKFFVSKLKYYFKAVHSRLSEFIFQFLKPIFHHPNSEIAIFYKVKFELNK